MKKSDFDLTHQNRNASSKIVASLERIAQAFRVLLWHESKAFGLSPIQVQVLIFLLHHSEEKRKVSYLADEFNMSKATLSDTIKALEEKKLITKKQELQDSRSYSIHLTKKGKDVAAKTSLFSKELRTPVDKLHPDNQENMLLGLMDIIRHLNSAGVITIQRMCMTCKYYHSSEQYPHFCQLLNQQLRTTDLRVDCPEHVLN